jgi:hypothetical protein
VAIDIDNSIINNFRWLVLELFVTDRYYNYYFAKIHICKANVQDQLGGQGLIRVTC